jgi:DNA polymerase-3 subunit alpha
VSWFPLHTHSHFSLLDGLSRPEQIAARVANLGYGGAALTDHASVSGAFAFAKAMKKHKLKAVLGCEFYICARHATDKSPENAALTSLCVLAESEQGWRNLVRAVSAANAKDHFSKKPRLSLEQLAEYAQDEWILFSGHIGSGLAEVCFKDMRAAVRAPSVEAARALLHEDAVLRAWHLADSHRQLFGAENFYLAIHLLDAVNQKAAGVLAEVLRSVSRQFGVPKLATANSHYCAPDDAPDHRVLLCCALETTLAEKDRKLAVCDDVTLPAFFKSRRYHIPTAQEMAALHTQDEMDNAVRVGERCCEYALGGKPLLPTFVVGSGVNPEDELRRLCEESFVNKVQGVMTTDKAQGYRARLEEELQVLLEAGLASYFLIVHDLVRYARHDLGCKVGKGRGSAAGCLVSWLIGITDVDPLRFGLLFERFYNAGRNSPGRVALPDIDLDFPVGFREPVIAYARAKYGEDRVCQMATFARMQGRGALKDVLRVNGTADFETTNRITEWIPDEAEIADQLQDMREETGEASIIDWALTHHADKLRDWAYYDDEGKLAGDLQQDFAQAMRLEGTKRGQGKHASGVIIASVRLADVVPMVHDKASPDPVVGVDMRDAEEFGLVKFDVLGTTILDKIAGAERLVRTGRMD